MRRAFPLLAFLAFLAFHAFLAGCAAEARTQVFIDLGADSAVQATIARLDVRVAAGNPDTPPEAFSELSYDRTFPNESLGLRWPIRFALVPSGNDPARRYLFEATVFDQDERPLTTVRAISGYRAMELRRLQLQVPEACVTGLVTCGAAETCDAMGRCVDATVDPATLQLVPDPDP